MRRIAIKPSPVRPKKQTPPGWSLLKGLGLAWTGLLFASVMTLAQNWGSRDFPSKCDIQTAK